MINFQNFCKFQGRLLKDPELTTTKNGKEMCKFALGVNAGKHGSGEKKSAFPRFTAFGKTAEFIADHFSKGKPMEVIAEYQTDSSGEGENRQYFHSFKVQNVAFMPFIPKSADATEPKKEKLTVDEPPKDWKDDFSKSEAEKKRAADPGEGIPQNPADVLKESDFDFGDNVTEVKPGEMADEDDVPF
jgi:single-strand DNA-binding protein